MVLVARWGISPASADEAKYGAAGMPNGWVDMSDVFIQIDEDGTVTIVNHRADIVSGQAIYGADIHFDDIVYAVIARPPVLGVGLGSVNDKAALKVPGVLKVVTIDTINLPPIFKPLGGGSRDRHQHLGCDGRSSGAGNRLGYGTRRRQWSPRSRW
jgi:hypothetical protein